jgi:hypothetical protein
MTENALERRQLTCHAVLILHHSVLFHMAIVESSDEVKTNCEMSKIDSKPQK